MKFSVFICILLTCRIGVSQSLNCEKFRAESIIELDSFPVEPSSISISPKLAYELDEKGTNIRFREKDLPDSIEICFRPISPVAKTPIFYRDISRYEAGQLANLSKSNQLKSIAKDDVFSFGSLNSYGAITRGVSFGNRQNVFVNSTLNLQMDGELGDNLKVAAMITDQNIPYQPEGNTQQIRDFDNVFIRLYNQNHSLTAGDIVLTNPVDDGYFLQYYKNAQGLQLSNKWKSGKWQNTSNISASLSKGQFTSAVITPIEGVQGPYKLRGAKGERFIIVLANSEKVFLDGKELTRGFDRDYVIDYNLAEITFSNTTVVTRFSRIRIDYEYANQYYNRTNLATSQEFKRENFHAYLNYYQEKDNPGNSLAFELSENDLMEVRNVGDGENGTATISGAEQIPFNETAILYEKIDTIDSQGNTLSVFGLSVNPNAIAYQVSFTQVAVGSYALLKTTSNGRIYEWVGEGNGSYEAIQVIPLPNRKSMLVAGAGLKVNAFETVHQEVAFSNQDQNLYSKLSDDNNRGLAWNGGISSNGRSWNFAPDYLISAESNFEYNHQNFAFIDRFRSFDFDRDWGYDVFADTARSRQDMIASTQLKMRKDAENGWDYTFKWRNRTGVIAGTQHELIIDKEVSGFSFSTENFLLENTNYANSTSWLRSRNSVQWTRGEIRPGYEYAVDQNLIRSISSDSVLSTLMNFQQHNVFVKSGDSSKVSYRFDFITRQDHLPVAGELMPYTQAEEYRFSFNTSKFENHRLSGQINFRQVDELINVEPMDRNVIGKVAYQSRFLDGHITNNLSITTANSRELRRDFVFVAVPTGEGTHTWRDENEDGIQDINEFYESINQDEKNYIKIFTPTDDYLESFQTAYIHFLEIKAPRKWRKSENALNRGCSKLSLVSNLRSNYKTTSDQFLDRLTPYPLKLNSEEIISARNLYRSSIFYNRNAPGFGIDLTRSLKGSKSLLTSGFQIKNTSDWQASYRTPLNPQLTFRGKLGSSNVVFDSDFLESRNFEIHQSLIENELVFQPSNHFRVISSYSNKIKKVLHTETAAPEASVNEFKLESTWTRASKGNLNATLSWVDINYDGATNTFLAYELLEALQPGSNQRWNVNWQQTLGRGMQLTLQYFGRKSRDQDPIHTGTVQVTAFF
ncbi:MAG: hypothetical protein JXR10_09145 [Cyclobacteriaceae bacterium]